MIIICFVGLKFLTAFKINLRLIMHVSLTVCKLCHATSCMKHACTCNKFFLGWAGADVILLRLYVGIPPRASKAPHLCYPKSPASL